MCEWGITKQVRVFIPAKYSYTGEDRWDLKPIDSCIADLVEVLNANGFYTIASCCGHGRIPGSIILLDGRELIIAPDYDAARIVYKAFPTIWGEEKDNG